MSEIAGALEGAGSGQQQQAGQQQQDGQQQPQPQAPVIPAWMEGLPDEYRTDADINRYQTVPDLLKGLKETRAWARGRVPIPGAEDEAGWTELGQRLRGESPEAYEVPVPDGQDAAMADRFKSFAHETGIPPRWAKAVAEFHNREQADALSALGAKAKGEMQAIELDLGVEAYNRRLEATANMLTAAGIEDYDVVSALQQTAGAGKTLKALFALAERTGELGKVDPTGVALRMGTLSPQAAQAQIDAKSNDREFMAKAAQAGTPEFDQWKAWNRAAAGGR